MLKEACPFEFCPTVEGLCDGGYGIVMSGKLTTAHRYFLMQAVSSEEHTTRVSHFLTQLTDALVFLHSHNFVHPELSLDSVLVEVSCYAI